jgi:hypothetical protein
MQARMFLRIQTDMTNDTTLGLGLLMVLIYIVIMSGD